MGELKQWIHARISYATLPGSSLKKTKRACAETFDALDADIVSWFVDTSE
jgi:hypothetical protein